MSLNRILLEYAGRYLWVPALGVLLFAVFDTLAPPHTLLVMLLVLGLWARTAAPISVSVGLGSALAFAAALSAWTGYRNLPAMFLYVLPLAVIPVAGRLYVAVQLILLRLMQFLADRVPGFLKASAILFCILLPFVGAALAAERGWEIETGVLLLLLGAHLLVDMGQNRTTTTGWIALGAVLILVYLLWVPYGIRSILVEGLPVTIGLYGPPVAKFVLLLMYGRWTPVRNES